MMKNRTIKHRTIKHTKLGGLMALVLFGLFAVCILSVILTGAGVYRKLTERDQVTYEKRTAVQYLTTKVRQADTAGWISAEEFEGLEALVISEDIGGTVYKTWIYCYDGYIRELFAAADSQMTLDTGEKVMEARGLQVQVDGADVYAELTAADGTVQNVVLHLRSGEEVIR